MTGWQRHAIHFGRVPGGDNMTSGVWLRFYLVQDLRDLVDVASIGCGPTAPLASIHWPEISVGIGPLIPDGYTVVLQVFDIRVAFEEPKELVNDRS